MIERWNYGALCGYIFSPGFNSKEYEKFIDGMEKRVPGIGKIYLEWKKHVTPQFKGLPKLHLWPGLEDPRSEEYIRKSEFESISIEEQIKTFTPKLNNGNTIRRAISAAIDGYLDLIQANGYTFIYQRRTFPLLYNIRSRGIASYS